MRKFVYCGNCSHLNAVDDMELEHTCTECKYSSEPCEFPDYEHLLTIACRYAIFEIPTSTGFDYSEFSYDDVIVHSHGDYIAAGGDIISTVREFMRMVNDAKIEAQANYYIIVDVIEETIIMG